MPQGRTSALSPCLTATGKNRRHPQDGTESKLIYILKKKIKKIYRELLNRRKLLTQKRNRNMRNKA